MSASLIFSIYFGLLDLINWAGFSENLKTNSSNASRIEFA